MNKVVCDICGTSYSDSAQCCPICGSSREYAIEMETQGTNGMPEYIPAGKKSGGRFSAANRKNTQGLYDYDFAVSDRPEDVLPEERFASNAAGRPKMNVFAVVVLTVLITVLLMFAGFLLFRYYFPNQKPPADPEEIVQTAATEPSEPETTVQLEIPCEGLVLTAGIPELTRIGQYWLLHVIATPEDTTDDLSYVSADESVVTVTEEGRLCAVGEGETSIVISCGDKQILCSVTVRIPDPTESSEAPEQQNLEEPETEATTQPVEPETEPTTQPTEPETEPTTQPTEPETEPTTQPTQLETEPTTQPTEPAQLKDVILKLKQSDITFTKKGVTFQLELDCDLSYEEVEWMTLDPTVAICHDGVITVIGSGVTKIVATYGDQQVYCIVRCNLKK